MVFWVDVVFYILLVVYGVFNKYLLNDEWVDMFTGTYKFFFFVVY